MVNSVGGVTINNPKGMEGGAKKRLMGGDVKGENIIYPLKPGEHPVIGKKSIINVGSHAWLPTPGKEELETIKGRKVSLVDRWILQSRGRWSLL